MSESLWTTVDDFLDSLHQSDRDLDEIREMIRKENLPDISVSAEQGRLLTILAKSVSAHSILEIGTLAGFGAVCLARSLTNEGRVVTLEVEETRARIAETCIAAANLADKVSVVVGPALETLPKIQTEYPDGFDFIFVDADKEAYPDYWRWSMKLSHPGTLIVADNVVRDGTVADPENHDPQVEGVRDYLRLATAEPHVLTSVIQTVGAKGYDGLALSLLVGE